MALPPIRIGGCLFDSATGELTTSGRRTSLRPQAAQVLSFLIARRGELVTRADLNRELWADGTWVDFAHAVTLRIYEIRSALGDSAESPRYIETFPRRGYRFIARVGDAPAGAAFAAGERTMEHGFPRRAVWATLVLVDCNNEFSSAHGRIGHARKTGSYRG
jgi:DNA-binding winged helix-turn-helix (wHTH) protein